MCSLQIVPGSDALSMEAQTNATLLFMSMIRGTLASKRVLREYRLNQEAFDWVVGEVIARFHLVSGLVRCSVVLECGLNEEPLD